MSKDNTGCGIYNDIDNVWMIYCRHEAEVELSHDGTVRLETSSSGVTVNSHLYTKTLECHGTGSSGKWKVGTNWGPVKEPGRSGDWWPNSRGGFYYSAIFSDYIKTSGISTLSDKRIKTNISELNDVECLNIVNKINTYKYDYINKENTNKNTYGFIAQDVFKHLPNAIQIVAAGYIQTRKTLPIHDGNQLIFLE